MLIRYNLIITMTKEKESSDRKKKILDINLLLFGLYQTSLRF